MSKSIKLNDDTYIAIESIQGSRGDFIITSDVDNAIFGFSVVRGSIGTLPSTIYLLLTLPSVDNDIKYRRQFMSPFTGNQLYTRFCNNGVWSDWKSIVFS